MKQRVFDLVMTLFLTGVFVLGAWGLCIVISRIFEIIGA